MTATPANRFRSVALLGEGGMARVYLVVSEGLAGVDKLVVLKLLRPELAHDEPHRAMFLDEARLAVKLDHPNIVHTYEAGEQGGLYFLMMEFLDGQPLSRLRQSNGIDHFPLALHLYVLVGLLRGLAYAHQLVDLDGSPLSIVHRDISPQNVFVTYDGRVKVVDFGIAKAAISREQTEAGVFKGKTAYAAPEQAMALKVDQRADVFSAGVMLWEAISGRRYWGDRHDVQALMELVNDRLPAMPEIRPDAPAALIRICARALKWQKEDRYATSAEFADALEQYLLAQPNAPGPRELAAWVTGHFAHDRSELRRKIEARAHAAPDATGQNLLGMMAAAAGPSFKSWRPEASAHVAVAATTQPPRRSWQRVGAWAFAVAGVGGALAAAVMHAPRAAVAPVAASSAARPAPAALPVPALVPTPEPQRLPPSAPAAPAVPTRQPTRLHDERRSPLVVAAPRPSAAPVAKPRATLDEESPYSR